MRPTRTLAPRREALTALASEDLASVAGGSHPCADPAENGTTCR